VVGFIVAQRISPFRI